MFIFPSPGKIPNDSPQSGRSALLEPVDTDDLELDPTTASSRILPVQARSGSLTHSRSGTIYNGFDGLKAKELLKVLNDLFQDRMAQNPAFSPEFSLTESGLEDNIS
jgi:hypothetical protein